MMKNIALLCLSVFLGVATWELIRLPDLVHKEIAATRGALIAEVQVTRAQLLMRVDVASNRLDKQLTVTRGDLRTQLDQTRGEVLKAVVEVGDGITAKVDAQLDRTNDSLFVVSSAINATADHVGDITADLHDQYIGPRSMGYSRMLAFTGEGMRAVDAGRRSAEEVAKAMPELSKSAVETSQHVADITANVKEMTKPKSWWKAILPALAGGAAKLIF